MDVDGKEAVAKLKANLCKVELNTKASIFSSRVLCLFDRTKYHSELLSRGMDDRIAVSALMLQEAQKGLQMLTFTVLATCCV